jgi:hypothetical protein
MITRLAGTLDSAILTGRLYMDNLQRLVSPELAIAAHRQGVTGVLDNGADSWYIERVIDGSLSGTG